MWRQLRNKKLTDEFIVDVQAAYSRAIGEGMFIGLNAQQKIDLWEQLTLNSLSRVASGAP